MGVAYFVGYCRFVCELSMIRLPLIPRYDSELHSAADLEGEGGGDRERALLQQLKLLREEKAHLKVCLYA